MGEFSVRGALLQVITPEPGLGFEGHLVFQIVFRIVAEIAFLAVDVSRYPVARDQVQAPAIQVEEVSVAGARLIKAIQSHNVVILVLYPNSATEAAIAGALLGGHIEDDAADISQELAVHVLEIVDVAIEVAVSVDHP